MLVVVVTWLVIYNQRTRATANPTCENGVLLLFSQEELMEVAASALRNDPEFTRVITETKQQFYDRLSRNSPDLARQLTPANTPAVVIVSVSGAYNRAEMRQNLAARYKNAKVVDCDDLQQVQPV